MFSITLTRNITSPEVGDSVTFKGDFSSPPLLPHEVKVIAKRGETIAYDKEVELRGNSYFVKFPFLVPGTYLVWAELRTALLGFALTRSEAFQVDVKEKTSISVSPGGPPPMEAEPKLEGKVTTSVE